ncbi:MAG: crossover junction endodeoxyribonuclease RuvC [Saccharofermentanales bacterium]
MTIMGIDPGYAITGYGIIEYKNNKFKILNYGVISTKSTMQFEKRLLAISDGLDSLFNEYKPDSMAIEELFFSRNTTTAIGTAQARGVAILCGAKAGLDIYEYTPLQVKMAVSGYGKADKNQVQQMVRVLLNCKDIIKPDDAADALAIAICHAHTGLNQSYLAKGGYQ